MKSFILKALLGRAEKIMASRKPDYVVGADAGTAYMERWWIVRSYKASIYVHRFLRSDDDRALHDHPWWNLSILLKGEYTEHTIEAGGIHKLAIRRAGDFKFRGAKSAHRIELHAGQCVTLFITGPVLRKWGFHCPRGWRPWQEFCKPDAKGEIGPGCD